MALMRDGPRSREPGLEHLSVIQRELGVLKAELIDSDNQPYSLSM